jgi:hypothetical protein
MDNSTPIQLYPAAGGDNERWSLISTGEGSFVILGKNSGKCLNVASGSVDNGAGIVQYDCANAANQKWYLIPLGEPAPSDGN